MIAVRFNSALVVNNLKLAVDGEIRGATDELLTIVKRRSPVRSGQFKRTWSKTVTKDTARVSNPQPYGQRLESGYSRQARKGVAAPAIQEVIKNRKNRRIK